jgi:hypothetical protein
MTGQEKELFGSGLTVNTKRMLLKAALFILQNPSKFEQTDNTRCLIAIALRLSNAGFEPCFNREAASRFLGLTYQQYQHLYINLYIPDNFWSVKQARTRSLLAVKALLELLTADGAKDATTAFAAVALDILNGGKYNQRSGIDCIWGKVQKYLGRETEYYASIGASLGVEASTTYRVFSATGLYWPSKLGLKLFKSKQNRTKRRVAAILAMMVAADPSAVLPPTANSSLFK